MSSLKNEEEAKMREEEQLKEEKEEVEKGNIWKENMVE